MISYFKFLQLVEVAERMGCKVVYDSKSRISFNPNMTITLPLSTTYSNTYALAHEIGHLMDYVKGELDYGKWLDNWSYRIHAEMSAWVNGYKLLESLNIPLDEWKNHVDGKLRTYFLTAEVV